MKLRAINSVYTILLLVVTKISDSYKAKCFRIIPVFDYYSNNAKHVEKYSQEYVQG